MVLLIYQSTAVTEESRRPPAKGPTRREDRGPNKKGRDMSNSKNVRMNGKGAQS